MRNVLKATTIENKLPFMGIERDCIVSKDGDITFCFKIQLPEIFSLTKNDYESMHATWIKAIKVLPEYTIVHKQDWYIEENYHVDFEREISFLERANELHFNERPFLNHTSYLFITKTTKERTRMQSDFSSLCRGNIIPKDLNKDTFARFEEAVAQFVQIMNDSGFIQVRQLDENEIVGTENTDGIIEKYLSLAMQETSRLQDIALYPDRVQVGDKRLCVHTLSQLDDLPAKVKTDYRFEKYSTDNSGCLLSYAAPLGLLLNCNHIFNQYVIIENSDEILRQFEKSARNMQSLSRYSRTNQINKEWIDLFLNVAHSEGLTAVRCHCNIIAWAESDVKLKKVKNEVGSQIAMMGCRPHYNTVDAATLFWAAIPGNSGDFPMEESFYTFLEPAVCFFVEESNYKDSLSAFGIKMCDRIGKPLHIDLWDNPMKQGIISNRNMFIVGGSGSGKSFFTNHVLRQYFEQRAHIVIVDVGNSYHGLCDLINKKTKGADGIYYTYTDKSPISFNPFYTEDCVFDIEKRESIKTLIMALWKKDTEPATRAEEVAVSNAIALYINNIKEDRSVDVSFNGFYEFVKTDYQETLRDKGVREKDFDIFNFLNVLEPFYSGGEYDFLLNSNSKIDLLHKRFVVFEVDAIKDHAILFQIVTLIIMEMFINKMRRLKGERKIIVIEEAWKALMNKSMEMYIKYLYKTVRKFYGSVATVTQEIDDIISSSIVKESIVNNSDIKCLLDLRKFQNKFETIQELLGLTEKEKTQVLSLNMANNPNRKYKEVFISLAGVQTNVYATEVSKEEYWVYTTEESEKFKLQQLTDELDGDIERAIKQLARENK